MKQKEKYSLQCRIMEKGCGKMCHPPDTEHSNWITMGLNHFNRCTVQGFPSSLLYIYHVAEWLQMVKEWVSIHMIVFLLKMSKKMTLCVVKENLHNMIHFQSVVILTTVLYIDVLYSSTGQGQLPQPGGNLFI